MSQPCLWSKKELLGVSRTSVAETDFADAMDSVGSGLTDSPRAIGQNRSKRHAMAVQNKPKDTSMIFRILIRRLEARVREISRAS